MSYGADQRAIFRRAAAYVDKILKGEKPANLPVEQPDQIRNSSSISGLRRVLGLTLPARLLVRADEVIE